MKKLVIAIVVVLGGLRAARAQQSGMAHSPVTVSPVTIEPIQFSHLDLSASGVNVEPLQFDTGGSGSALSAAQHLDFGSRDLNIEHLKLENSGQSDFSNIRLQFENPQYQHLNFDGTSR